MERMDAAVDCPASRKATQKTFTQQVHHPRMNAINLGLFDLLAAGTDPSPWLLALARAFALGGSWAAAAVIGIALWRRAPDRPYLLIVLALAGLTTLLTHAIAEALDLPRPFMLGLSPAWIPHGDRGSLPSSHASVMFFIAFACLVRPALRRYGMALALLACLTAWARICVGVHFPLDIVAGALLAAVLAGALAGAAAFVRWCVNDRQSAGVAREPVRQKIH